MRRRRSLLATAEFERFFQQYHPRLRAYLAPYLSDHTVADDLAQETLLRAYRHAIHLEGDREVWPWLRKVARNLASDVASRGPSAHEVRADLGQRADATDEEESLVAAVAAQTDVAEVLGTVTDRQARVLLAYYVEGHCYEEIAAAEGISPHAVGSILYRARRAFRHRYEILSVKRVGAAVIFLVGWARARLRGVRERAREAAVVPAEFQVLSAHGMSTIATGAALGVLGVLGALSPAATQVTTASDVAVGPALTTEVTQAAERPTATPVVEAAPPAPIEAPAPALAPPHADVPPPTSGSQVPNPVPGAAEPALAASIQAGEVLPVEEPPGKATANAEGEGDGSITLDREVNVPADVDGDGDDDASVTNNGETSADCRPEYRRWLTSITCPVYEAVLDPPTPGS